MIGNVSDTQIVKLMRTEEIAEGTMAFHFTRPPGFEFRPGQSIDMTLVDPPETDGEGNTRAFSIASPPFENQLTVATRMRDSAFKRVLRNASPGLEVKIESPGGSFTLHKNATKPAVFLAGGIGITPFLSMARQAAKEKALQRLYLLYSNRRPEDAAFLDILQELEKSNPNFKLICTMTDMAKSMKEWKGETGIVDKEMLSRHLTSLQGPIYYIAGPPAMVVGVRKVLVDANVDEDDIRTEDFAGY
jgi:ferredoxin-NADP reductase